jgi:23S rRNA (adenine-N6)-dimethyltransferase
MARHRDPTLWRTQNFLHDPALVARLVAASDIEASDVVYDLGAGTGSLTAALAQRASHVVAIEKDHALVAALRRRFAGVANVVIREADMFAHPLPRAGHVVFASPPFDRTAELMRKLTAADVPPRLAYLVLQREAAERYIGKPRRTLVAALLAPQFAFEVVHRFAPDDFAPSPHVAVVLLRGQNRAPPLVPGRDMQFYRDLVVASFVAGVTPLGDRVRPSELSAEAWLDLYRRLRSFSGARRVVAGAEARLRRQQQRLHRTHRTRAPRDALGVTFSGLRHDRALLVDVVRHEYRGTGPDRKGDPVGGTAVQRGL